MTSCVVERDDTMYNDFEYLYMIRTQDRDALEFMFEKFNKLIWKRAHTYFIQRRPIGITVDDLYQEGLISLHTAFYSYDESMEVGLAYYIELCVESSMKSLIRKSRGKSYGLLNTEYSLDMSISEDNALFLHDVVADKSFINDPIKMSDYLEAKKIEKKVLLKADDVEVKIYKMRESGYSYSEISKVVNLSEKKVDNLLQKMKRALNNESNEKA